MTTITGTAGADILTGTTADAIERVSTSTAGVQGAGDSVSGSYSPDGTKLAFFSNASNLVAGDVNGTWDVFVKDLATGVTSLESTSASGVQGNGAVGLGQRPVFSPDGTKLLFDTSASLSPADPDVGSQDVYIKDLLTGAVTLLSANASGVVGNSDSFTAVFSPDGTKVAFSSAAWNLVPGDVNDGQVDLFVKDLATGAVTKMAPTSVYPLYSPNGAELAFTSRAALDPTDTNGVDDVYVLNLATGAFTLASSDGSGAAGDDNSFGPLAFSPDGTKLAFYTASQNLGGPADGNAAVFIKDLTSGTLTYVANAAALPDFSPDGTRLTFSSGLSLVAADTNQADDVYIQDLATGVMTLGSTNAFGAVGNGQAGSDYSSFSPDGAHLVFESSSTNLVPGDTNGVSDVFIKTIGDGADVITGGGGNDSIDGGGGDDAAVYSGALADYSVTTTSGGVTTVRDLRSGSPDGTDTVVNVEHLRFSDQTVDLTAPPPPPLTVSGSAPSAALVEAGVGGAGVSASAVTLSTSGAAAPTSYVLTGWTHVSGSLYSQAGTYGSAVLDTAANTLSYALDNASSVTNALAGGAAVTDSFTVAITDGTSSASAPIAFAITGADDAPVAGSDTASAARNNPITLSAASLLANDTDPEGDALTVTAVGGAQHGTVSLSAGQVTFTPAAGYVGAAGFNYTVSDGHGGSATGQVSVAVSSTLNGTSGDDVLIGSNGGAISLVSADAAGVPGNGNSGFPYFSSDGTKFAFASGATNLGPAVGANSQNIYLKDLITGAVTLLSADGSGAPATAGSTSAGEVLSPDGSKVVFDTNAANLGGNGQDQIVLKDLLTGAVTLLSTSPAGAPGDHSSYFPTFSPDASKVIFEGAATNLVPGTSYNFNIFVKDLNTGAMALVSSDAAGHEGNSGSQNGVFSPDGGRIAFESAATNLTSVDANGFADDIFIRDLATGVISLASTNSQGVQGNAASELPTFSPDGTKLAFVSYATNLVAGDTNGRIDLFVKDLVTGVVTRVDTDASGGQAIYPGVAATANTFAPTFSPDGTKLAFVSNASSLVPGDTNGTLDVFVKDLVTGAITRVSTDVNGAQGNGGTTSVTLAFSPDGTSLAFANTSSGLVPGDVNGAADVFIKDITDPGARNDVINGFAGNDLLLGRVGDDVLNGGDGADTLNGGAGNDTIDGGADNDTAVFSGSRQAYLVSETGVVFTVSGPDGIDTVTNVETFQFADRILSAAAVLNDAPTANADVVTTAYLTPLVIPGATLVANDTDPDGDVLVVSAVGSAQHGTVSLSGGAVTFTPYRGFVGAASFSYTASDGLGGLSSASVTVNVTGSAPAYIYRAGVTAAEIIDTSGDGSSHSIVTGSGDTTIYTGSGSTSTRLGAGNDVVIGGAGKDTVTFGPGLGTVTGGAGPDDFILVKGQITDPTAHGGQYDTVTDFTGAGAAYVAGRDFIHLKGFATTATITYEHDLAGDPTAHLYRIDDGAYHAEFVLAYASPGVALSHSQFGFL